MGHMMLLKLITGTLLFCFLYAPCVVAGPAIIADRSIFRPVEAKRAMAVTGERLATGAALAVLKAGGNAVDAAVTAGFVLAVTMPRAGNIGGGGFMLIYSARTKKVIAIDYRETAPQGALRDMFLDEAGNVDSEKSRFSHLAAGVPGTVAGLTMALKKYGTISLKDALRPAITLAESGFEMSAELSSDIKRAEERLKKWPSTRKIFFKKDGSFFEPGDLFIQKDLGLTLKRIARHGLNGFYEGKTAQMIEKQMRANKGLVTKKDLKGYSPVIRRPVKGSYRGLDIYSMSPPSSGGVHIVEILNVLEGYDLKREGHNSAATIHLMAEAMKRAYADRSKYLGDPDFADVPLSWLTSKKYAKEIRGDILPSTPTPSKKIGPGRVAPYESDETTHFSVVDEEGNAVSNTYTINFSFGSGIVVDGAGFLLNNEMDDFSAKPGVPNAYGLVGGEANSVEAGKRMLSSMSPTIVMKDDRPLIVTGTPGGSRIITTIVQIIMNVVDFDMNIQEAVNAPRMHHQWLPDEIRVEKGIGRDTVKILEGMGHKVKLKRSMGAASSIMIEDGALFGSSDPRREGLAAGY